MGYLTWIICNIAVIYGVGYGAMKLIEAESIGTFILYLTVGVIMLMLALMLSLLCLALVANMFGDEKVENKLIEWLPFLKW